MEAFNEEELFDIQEKFQRMEQEFSALKERQEITEEQFEMLLSTIAELNREAPNLPKKTWYRSAGQKMITVSEKVLGSKAGQGVIGDGVRKLLGLE